MGAPMRTDATRFCPRCLRRFGGGDRCPGCDAIPLGLETASARRRALALLARGPLRRPSLGPDWPLTLTQLWFRRGLLPLAVLGGVAGAVGRAGWVIGFGAAFALQLALLALLVASYFSYVWLRGLLGDALPRPSTARLELLPPGERRSATEASVRGRVLGPSSLRSPLEHRPCVAYRLVGAGPVGAVDDADACAFDLELDDGEVVHVEAPPCSVDIDVQAPPRTVRPSPELTLFLERRGVFPERGPLELAEATLREGDLITVRGERKETLEAGGYRQQGARVILLESHRTRLTLRRTES